jgi:hypothetical protein
MPNEKNRFTCHYPDCSKPATRALTYFVDAPTTASLDPKQEVFSDEHAEAETLNLQTPALFTQTQWDGTTVAFEQAGFSVHLRDHTRTDQRA